LYVNKLIYVRTKERRRKMSPRTGRPTEAPKTGRIELRLSDQDREMLEFCCEATGKTKAEVIREGIQKVYEGLKK